MRTISEDELEKFSLRQLSKMRNIKRIYKYISFDNGLQYLINDNKLKFNSPNNFNDPLDCNPIIIKYGIPEDKIKNFINKLPFKNILFLHNYKLVYSCLFVLRH